MDSPYRLLPNGPFTRRQALAAGITSRMLQGDGFVRLYPRVWRRKAHVMTEDDWVRAAQLALPGDARLTGISRIRAVGLDYGPWRPLHFVVARDLHLDFEGVFLHRTEAMPPLDDVGVCVEAAFLAYCVRCRVIDAIKVGDWLLHNAHMDLARLKDLALAQQWRDGADEALWILEHLDPDSWSLKESETRAAIVFAGLPRPECNRQLHEITQRVVIVDMLYREPQPGVVVEFEGGPHREDQDQYERDIGRYALMRSAGVSYVQVTNAKLKQPRKVVNEVHRELVAHGYDGPAPLFGERWQTLFRSLRAAVGPRDWRRPSA